MLCSTWCPSTCSGKEVRPANPIPVPAPHLPSLLLLRGQSQPLGCLIRNLRCSLTESLQYVSCQTPGSGKMGTAEACTEPGGFLILCVLSSGPLTAVTGPRPQAVCPWWPWACMDRVCPHSVTHFCSCLLPASSVQQRVEGPCAFAHYMHPV